MLESSGEARRANRLQHRIADIERRLRYAIPAATGANPQVHAIGLYSCNQLPPKVLVTATSSPVVLVLTAYSSAQWAVEAANEVQFDLVICTGYHRQTVVGGVPGFSYCYDDRTGDYAYALARIKQTRTSWQRSINANRCVSVYRRPTAATTHQKKPTSLDRKGPTGGFKCFTIKTFLTEESDASFVAPSTESTCHLSPVVCSPETRCGASSG